MGDTFPEMPYRTKGYTKVLDTKGMFRIPEEYLNVVPCQTNSVLFTDPALDIDMEEDSWLELSLAEQDEVLQAKEAAEHRAKAACNTCPILKMCREADEKSEIKAFGVVGGLTYEERTNPTLVLESKITHTANGQVSDDMIERWTAMGMSNAMIAQRAGVHPRTIERRKSALASNTITSYTGVAKSVSTSSSVVDLTKVKAPKRAAGNPLQPARVTSETAAIYDALLDGTFKDRSDIIDLAIDYVDRQVAYDRAPKDRTYTDDEARIRIGARKFLMNRIDIAVRSGRIHEATAGNGRKMIALEAGTVKVWGEWKSAGKKTA